MGLCEHLEKQLQKDYELLKNLEDRLRTETDPRLELNWQENIKKLEQKIRLREKELESCGVSSVGVAPVKHYLYESESEPHTEASTLQNAPSWENRILQAINYFFCFLFYSTMAYLVWFIVVKG